MTTRYGQYNESSVGASVSSRREGPVVTPVRELRSLLQLVVYVNRSEHYR